MRAAWLFGCAAVLVALTACGGDDDGMVTPDSGPGVDDGGTDGGMVVEDSGPPPECEMYSVDAPPTRGEINGALDAARNRIIVFGGNTAAPEMCMPRYELVDEMWAYHIACGRWEQLFPAGGPGIRARHATTVDTTRNRMLMFGGRLRAGFGEYTNFADVWAFDFATDTWTEIVATGEAPSPRSSAVAVYDEARDRLIVSGGNTSTSGLVLTGTADLYALDLATTTWTRIDATGGPPPRLFHAGVVVGNELVIFGGTPDYDGPFLDDTYALDLTSDTWRQVHPGGPGAPADRFGGEIFADAERGRVLLVGGHDGTDLGNRNDVWALDLAAGTWSEVRPGDTLNGAPSGLCMFPADFTIPEENAPERRYSFLHVQNATTAYVFGGKTDCGNVNDVWSLALADGAWTLLRATTAGEACNRTGRTDCTTLCY